MDRFADGMTWRTRGRGTGGEGADTLYGGAGDGNRLGYYNDLQVAENDQRFSVCERKAA